MRPGDLGIGRLFEHIRDAVIGASAETGRIVLWKPAASALLGYSEAEALDLPLEALVPERLRAQHRAGFARFRATGHGAYLDAHALLDLPALHRDGRELRIEMTLSPIEAAGDGRRFALAILRDVTERRRAEADLAASEGRYRRLIANAPLGIFSTDTGGRILEANPLVAILLGLPAAMPARSLNVLEFPPFAEAGFAVDIRRCLRYGDPLISEHAYARPDGRTRHLRLYLAPIFEVSGAVEGVQAHVEDVSARKRTEQELRESGEQYKGLVEHAGDLIYKTSPQGCFTFVNPTAVRVMGYTERELLGKHFTELIHPDYREQAAAFYQEQILGRIPNTYYEFPAVAKDGREVWIGQNVQLLLRGDRVVETQAVARDISEQKRAQEALREAERREARLRTTMEISGTVAHELNQPLAEVLGYLELLQAGRFGPDQQGEIYGRMVRAARDMERRIKAIERLGDYVTKTYGPDITVVDLEQSGGAPAPEAGGGR